MDSRPHVAQTAQPPPLDSSPQRTAREQRRRANGLLDGVVDSHVHPFPAGFLRALRDWFDAHAWGMRFRGDAEECLDVLARAGVGTVVALVYAHRPGAASFLNAYVGELGRAHPHVVPVGTVFPGEPDARRIVREAVSRHGVRGIKLHCHVQAMAIDDSRVVDVLSECAELRVPAIVHAGREPRSAAYAVDPHALCSAARTANVLRALPRLRLVVPHLGYDEIDAYIGLLGEHENLFLDTAMTCAEYFGVRPELAALERHADRIMYGSDFPITPYEADRELVAFARSAISDEAFERITRTTARAFWQLGAGSGR